MWGDSSISSHWAAFKGIAGALKVDTGMGRSRVRHLSARYNSRYTVSETFS